MKCTVLQENFLHAMQDAVKFVSTKPQLPILSCVKVEAHKGEITLSSTDLRMGFQTTIGGKVEKEGICAVPAKLLLDFLSSISPGSLDFNVSGENITLTYNGSKTMIQGMLPQDFPSFPEAQGEEIPLDKKDILAVVQKTAIAAGIDETKPIFSSIFWDVENDKVVCTDGYRLAVHRVTFSVKKEIKGFLTPARVVSELFRMMEKAGEKKIILQVSEELRQVFVRFGKTLALVRLTDGQFPDYTRILPKEFLHEALIDKEDLEKTIKTAMIFARESSGIVKLSLEKDGLTVSSSSSGLGTHQSTILVNLTKGEGGEIAFNGKFVLECLSAIGSDKVWFGMNESLTPGLFKEIENEEYSYIVMPFRVQK